jgi:DNA-binding transcriptional MerR regulator
MECVDRVRLIRRALLIGFSLNELANIFAERDRGGVPCHSVRASVETRLVELDKKLREFQALKRDLRALLREWDAKLALIPRGKQARLLDHLAERSEFGAMGDCSPRIHTRGNLKKQKSFSGGA